MVITFVWNADEHAIIADDAFDGQIGEPIPIRVGEKTVMGELKRATVINDGRSVEITYTVPDSVGLSLLGRQATLSDSFSLKRQV
jgi:hypothetical protein